MATRIRILTAAAATLIVASGAGFVLAQDVSGLLNQRRLEVVREQPVRVAPPLAPLSAAPVQPETPPMILRETESFASVNGLIGPALEDPNAQPYLPSAGPAILPPIRPSEAELRRRAESERLRALRARQEAAITRQAPSHPAFSAQRRSSRICGGNRCPAENMIGIQY